MKVFLVDDEPLANRRLKELLKSFPEIQIVGEAISVKEAVCQISRLRPDLVFVDMEIGSETGFTIIDNVLNAGIHPGFIVVSAFDHYAIQGIRYKVDDYLLKPINISDLSLALQRFTGRKRLEILPLGIAPSIPLSQREQSVLLLILEGKTSDEIGMEMKLSRHTIDTYRRNILRKVGVKNTLELVRRSKMINKQD